MGTQISTQMKAILNQKELYKSALYSETFKHTHVSKYSNIQIGCSFAYQSRELFENYLLNAQRRGKFVGEVKMSVESDASVSAVDQFT